MFTPVLSGRVEIHERGGNNTAAPTRLSGWTIADGSRIGKEAAL